MWPFKRGASARQGARGTGPVIDAALGDEAARRLHADLDRGDWATARDFLATVHDADDLAFYVRAAGRARGVQDWIEEWIAAEPRSILPLLVRGAHAIEWAWDARGSGPASSVSQDQFQVFFQRLKLSENCLDEATELDPDDPTAWSLLVITGRGRQVGVDETVRRFKETTARYRWHRSAHVQMLQQFCLKWGGSHELMHGFAAQTLAEMPPGNSLGDLVVNAHLEHWLKLPVGEDEEYMRSEPVLADLHAAADKSVRHPAYQRQPGWPVIHNTFAMAFFMAGDVDAAAEQFDIIGDLVTEWPWQYQAGDPAARFAATRAAAFKKRTR